MSTFDMLTRLRWLRRSLICPSCQTPLSWNDSVPPVVKCASTTCRLYEQEFLQVNNQLILVDFHKSILNRDVFEKTEGRSTIARGGGGRVIRWVTSSLLKKNYAAQRLCKEFLERTQKLAAKNPHERPRILIIGGGAMGSGSEALYHAPSIDLISFDIYVSIHTHFVSDAHSIPIADKIFHGVWIQAVLEHVLDPSKVVSEIHRVLVTDGIVFADTPFMQQVHEGAYDFTRFTMNGHRWLFRWFELIKAGVSGGPATALEWSIRYFVRAITRSSKVARISQLLFFWLPLIDRFCGGRFEADGASGVYFLGKKSSQPVSPKEIVQFYSEFRGRR